MSPLSVILVLALAAPAEVPALAGGAPGSRLKAELQHYPGATKAYECTFEPGRDSEVYGWPPSWTRRYGPGFPRYVRIRVDDDRPPPGGRCLRVDLNGGAASAFGPSTAVDPGIDYVLESFLKTSALEHDAAWLSLTFLDSARLKLSSIESNKIAGTTSWQKLRIGPIAPPPEASTMVIGIHVAPQGEAQDIQGTASFGSLWIGSLPRVVLTARSVEAPPRTQGTANFDEASKSLMPRRDRSDTAFFVFVRQPQQKAQPIELTCLASGVVAPRYDVQLVLEDGAGHVIAKHTERFAITRPPPDGPSTKKTPGSENPVTWLAGNSAHVSWQIPVDAVGFYRVRARVLPLPLRERAGETGVEAQQDVASSSPSATLSLAIVDRQSPAANSEFGWSLDPADIDLGLWALGDLLTKCGIRSVKFPFVSSLNTDSAPAGGSRVAAKEKTTKSPAAKSAKERGTDYIETLISFSDRLAVGGVRLIGVLLPPTLTAAPGAPKYDPLAVDSFAADPKTWYPSIEPVLARLATEIRFWQIGDDRDPGWVNCAELASAISRIKKALDQIGQDLDIGVAWDLAAPLPVAHSAGVSPAEHSAETAAPQRVSRGTLKASTSENSQLKPGLQAPWRFLTLPCNDAVTETVLADRLDGTASAHVARWLAIEALPRAGHTEEERIAHLARRMIAAKIHGAEGIFFAHPFDADRGLIGHNGAPTELFLPWHTTALLLGGAPYAGDIDCAGGNRIQCFGSHGKYVGVLAGGAPQRDAVYLGDKPISRDLWGRDVAMPLSSASQPSSSLEIQRLPVFLTGLDPSVTDWQLHVAFAPQSLPSIPLADAHVVLQAKNTWTRNIAGRVRITPPRNWQVEPPVAEFRIESGRTWKQPLEVSLPRDVVAGRQTIALEFDIQADCPYRFTMYRAIDIALGDVTIDAHAKVNEQGDLEVRQTLINRGTRSVNFRCDLAVPDRRRQSTEILLQPSGKNEYIYHLPDGRELLGKPLWLRAEEIDGPRVLNYRLECASR